MCGSIVDIQSATAEIRRGKKEERWKKPQDDNIMVCPITQGDHKKPRLRYMHKNLTKTQITKTSGTICYKQKL